MHIAHLTLQTGHTRRIKAGEVPGEVLARVRPWLAALVASGRAMPLPVAAWSEYCALALVQDGGLVVTISGPPLPDGRGRPPLVSLGVARRSRHGAVLWPLMTGPVMPAPAHGVTRPPEPWCAAAIWPSAYLAPDSAVWLGDLERCIAWAWCTSDLEETAGEA